jgi:hypothetical protein
MCGTEVGPELFIEGTWSVVCPRCGAEHAPDLVEMLETYRQVVWSR